MSYAIQKKERVINGNIDKGYHIIGDWVDAWWTHNSTTIDSVTPNTGLSSYMRSKVENVLIPQDILDLFDDGLSGILDYDGLLLDLNSGCVNETCRFVLNTTGQFTLYIDYQQQTWVDADYTVRFRVRGRAKQ